MTVDACVSPSEASTFSGSNRDPYSRPKSITHLAWT